MARYQIRGELNRVLRESDQLEDLEPEVIFDTERGCIVHYCLRVSSGDLRGYNKVVFSSRREAETFRGTLLGNRGIDSDVVDCRAELTPPCTPSTDLIVVVNGRCELAVSEGAAVQLFRRDGKVHPRWS